mmetsp:Transcript_17478/g.33213  ORF Transcript_17478/g.33213 Transcript_17478/m.33213 type:complete len:396 (+) Transcript_17478:284-1471(+)|eukprot:scaffold4019_cov143-Amphora_coffeaeformis.AAC.1
MSAKSEAMKTPPRNNYANPHTPIASIKRPRSSMERGGSSRSNSGRSLGPGSSRRLGGSDASTLESTPENCMSPMHPPKPVERKNNDHVEEESTWVGRKVDALFSPVITYFNQQEIHNTDSTEDRLKDDMTQPTASDSSSPSNGTTSLEGDDDVDVDDTLSVDSMQPIEDDHSDDDEFNPWQFIKSLPPYNFVRHLRPTEGLPPKSQNDPPITLVLDLDETLVHCTVEDVQDADLTFPVLFHGINYQVNVRIRPYLQDFFKRIHGHFEVVVFTASQRVYANELLDRIDPDKIYIKHRLFRESCLPVEGNFLKDLNVLNRDLTKTILVDNSPHAFGYQVDNGIPIESWFEDPKDTELLKLAKFLKGILGQDDVRPMIREKFQSQQRVESARKINYMN